MAKLLPGEILRRGLTSTRAISTLGIAIWLPWGLLRVIYRSAIANLSATLAHLALTTVIIAAVSVLATWVIRNTLLRQQHSYHSNPWLTLLSYLILLVVLSMAQETIGLVFGTSVGFSISRLATGLIGLYLIAALLDYFDLYRASLDRLQTEQKKLDQIRRSNVHELARTRSLVVQQLTGRLAAPWREIKNRVRELANGIPESATLHGLADSIRNELIAPIRDLSYEIQPEQGQDRPAASSSEANSNSTEAWLNPTTDYEVRTNPDRLPTSTTITSLQTEATHPMAEATKPRGAASALGDLTREPATVDAQTNRKEFSHKLVNWREVGARLPTQHPFYPLLASGFLAVLSFGNTELANPLGILVGGCTIFIVMLVLLMLARVTLTTWLARQSVPIAWTVWFTTILGICLAGITAVWFVYSKFGAVNIYHSDLEIVISSTLLAAFVAVIISLCATVFFETKTARAAVVQTVEATRLEAVAIEQELAATKQQIAHILHGEVQSMLTTAAFRLDLAAEGLADHLAVSDSHTDQIDSIKTTGHSNGSGPDSSYSNGSIGSESSATNAPGSSGKSVSSSTRTSNNTTSTSNSVLDEVFFILQEATAKIDSIAANTIDPLTQTGQPGLQNRIQDVCAAWNGLVEISAQVDQVTANRIDTRVNMASLTPIVTDVVREAILNAVRHAGAEHVAVTIESSEIVCSITVANDGKSPGSDTAAGLGLETLNRLGYEWSLTAGYPTGGILTIQIPLLTDLRSTDSQ